MQLFALSFSAHAQAKTDLRKFWHHEKATKVSILAQKTSL